VRIKLYRGRLVRAIAECPVSVVQDESGGVIRYAFARPVTALSGDTITLENLNGTNILLVVWRPIRLPNSEPWLTMKSMLRSLGSGRTTPPGEGW
jgi:hypothetical protein